MSNRALRLGAGRKYDVGAVVIPHFYSLERLCGKLLTQSFVAFILDEN
jgi:hypothetical protein